MGIRKATSSGISKRVKWSYLPVCNMEEGAQEGSSCRGRDTLGSASV